MKKNQINRKVCILVLLAIAITQISVKSIFADDLMTPFENDKKNEKIYRLNELKTRGITFSIIGLGIIGIGRYYYNDYLTYRDDLDYPAYGMGIGIMSVGTVFLGTGSYMFFKNRSKLKELETNNIDYAIVSGISKDSIQVNICLSFNLDDIINKFKRNPNKSLNAEPDRFHGGDEEL